MNLTRIVRLLQLVGLLQGGRGYNTDTLSQTCGVSRRTIFRDLSVLRQSGVPLVFDEQKQHFHIPGPHFLPPTNITPEEALSLLVLCNDLGDQTQLPFFEPARSAALKVASLLPDRLREHLRVSSDLVKIRLEPSNQLAGHRIIYQQLLDSLADCLAVRIRYESLAEEELLSTRLHPYRLLFSRRSWYVIGRSSLHRDTRTFNVGRIHELEVLEDSYEIPRGFSVERYLGNAWHLIPELGPDQEVLIRFSKLVAKNVAEVAWHKTQRVEFNEDGTLDFRVTVSGVGEISWWVLGYGDQAEVLSPPKLRAMVAQRIANLAKRYESPES